MRNSTYYLEIGQGVKSLRGSDRGFDCRLTVVRPSADRRFMALKVLTVLLLILTVGVGNVFGDELTVADGTSTNECIPLFGYYGDTGGTTSQVIYPASILGDLAGGTIESLMFYANTTSASWSGTWAVSLAEVSNTSLSGIITPSDPVEVFRGKLSIVDGKTTITFTTPFEYSGENNLLVEIALKSTGNCPSAYYLGISSSGSSWCSKKYQNQNFLPKVTFTYTAAAPVTCAKPSDLINTTLSASSATFTWSAGGSEGEWQYICLPAATPVDWGSTSVKTATSTTATVDELSPTTDYKFYVRANCGASDGVSKEISAAFTTPCGVYSLPWEYGFESSTETGSGKIPSCWSAKTYGSSTIYPYVIANSYSTYSRSGNNCLYFYGGASSSPQSIILPEFDTDLKDLTLSFYYNNQTTDTDYPTLRVGYYSIDGDPSSTFVLYGTALELTSGYKLAEIDLKDIPTTVKHLVIYYADGDLSHAVYVDDIKLIRTPNCNKPSELSCTSVTVNTATLAWTAGGSETAWNVRYKADGDADWTVVPANANPFTLPGLSGNTHYTAQVQADCGGDQSEWNSTSAIFKTECGAILSTELPWSYGFEDVTPESGEYIIPDCWARIPDDNNTSVRPNAGYSTYSRTGTKSLWLYGGTTYGGAKTIVFPEFEENIANLTVEFYYKTTSTGSNYGKPTIGYINTAGTFVGLHTFDQSASNAYAFAEFAFPSSFEDTPANIAIQYAGGTYAYSSGNMYIDDISVKKTPDCVKPTNLVCDATTATTATLSWTKGKSETAWKVQYSTSATFASDNVEVNAATNSAFEITGLAANTLYYVHVQAACESEYSDAISFRTDCEAITSFPWSADFETYPNYSTPVCWDNSGSTSVSYNPSEPIVWTTYNFTSSRMLWMKNFHAKSGTALINTPSFVLPSDKAYELKFDYANFADCGPLKVKISQNGGEFAEVSSYAESGSTTYSDPGTLNEAIISLEAYKGKTITIQFFAQANFSAGAIYIDNLEIRLAPSCFKPATLNAATDITPDGATFSWTASASNNENYYQYICVPTGETPNWATSTKVAKAEENQAVISGKAAGTYDFYVRSWCAEEDQSEAVKGSFTTATIPAPASVSVTGITNNSALAEWTAPSVAYAVQYQYSLVQSGDPVWSAATSDLSHLFDGLTASTNYTLYVRTYFDATHVGAQASTSFTTMCDPIVISSVAYKEDFSSFPVCWDNSEGTTTNSSYKWSSVAGGKEGNGMRFEGVGNDLGNTNIFASPFFTLNADADLTFYWKNAKTGEYKVQIAVKGGAREDLVTGLVSTNAWTKAEKALTEYQGKTIQLFFCGTSANDGNANLYLDELSITPVSCRKPAALNEATAITTDGATLTWTAGGADDYQYAVAEVGTAEGDLVWNNISALSVTLTGLQASTSYDFYVRTYCDGENQSEARKVNFKTTCGVAVLPFEENFNTTARLFIPDCWNNTEGTSADSYKWSVETYSGKNSTNGVRFNSSTNDDGATSILATPEIQLGAEKYILSFWCKNPTGGDFKVQIEGEGIAREDLLTGLTGIADWTLKYIEVPAKFANKKVQLFFCGTSNAGDANAYISVDNIRVARGEIFADGGSPESRLAGMEGQTIDFIMERPMQFNGYYNTLCLPFDLSAAQLADPESPLYNNTVKVFDYATIDNAAEMELQLAIAGASDIQAGVPYFVKYDGAAGAARNNFLFKEVRIAASTAGSKEDSGVEYRGIFNPLTVSGNEYIFVGAENQLYWPGVNRTMNNFRAYFYVSENAAVGNIPVRRGMIARIVEREETTTGINEISNDSSIRAQKVLENDQVVIIRNGVKYNMQGKKIQ